MWDSAKTCMGNLRSTLVSSFRSYMRTDTPAVASYRVCRSCEDLGVVSGPLPPRIIEKCLASDRIVIDTVISKYCNHTPLHRQSVILARDIGLEISRATLHGLVLKVGELLIPMVAAMRRELISGNYIPADKAPVDVQTREGRGKNHQAHLWQYSRRVGSVVFAGADRLTYGNRSDHPGTPVDGVGGF